LAEADDQLPMQTEEPPREENDPDDVIDEKEVEDDDVALSKKAFDLAAVIHAEILTGLLGDIELRMPSTSIEQAKTPGKKKKKMKKKKTGWYKVKKNDLK